MDCGQLIASVSKTLNDVDHVRWPVEDLMSWLNAGCMEVCRTRPEASEVRKVLTLAQGTRQELGAGDLQLLRVIRNVPSGRAVRLVESSVLDSVLPHWHNGIRADDIKEYGWNKSEPRVFWVYPPAKSTAKVECAISALPKPVSVPSDPNNPVYDPFPLPAEYAQAVEAWMLYRAYMQDTGAGSAQKAQTWSAYFSHSLGVRGKSWAESRPKE